MGSFYFYSCGITLNVSLFLLSSFSQIDLFSSVQDPLFFWPLSLLQLQSLFLPLQLFCFYPEYQGYISLTLSISSPSYLGILTTWGLRVLFRLSHAPLMQQKLGSNPLINVEVKTVLLLAPFRSFLWLLVSSKGHTLIIRASRFG